VSDDERVAALEDLRESFRGVMAATRRMRGRDTQRGGGELGYAQLMLLAALYERGALPAGELACAAELTPATVTQMLDNLAAAGHVERARSEDDRRVVVTRLTTQGSRRVEAKRAEWEGRWARGFADLEPGDLRAGAAVLARIRAMLEEMADA
jgi:DNA-binding MarR family transcriptional regulator